MLSVVFAALFLVLLFLIKSGLAFNSLETYRGTNSGLVYSSAVVGDLINKSTTGDGIPDWEKVLYGLDPTKRENTPGVPDSVTIAKLKATQESSTTASGNAQGPENLTQTDKFSRELFSTVAALNQSGAVDQATIDKVSSSLADHIKNTAPRKVYTLTDIKISKDESLATIKSYATTLDAFYTAYKTDYSVMDVLHQFVVDANTVDVTVLTKLDPIIKQTDDVTRKIAAMSVPESFASLHLELLNAMEKVMENISDIKLYEIDTIVALAGISQYQDNVTLVQNSLQNLGSAIGKKLNN